MQRFRWTLDMMESDSTLVFDVLLWLVLIIKLKYGAQAMMSLGEHIKCLFDPVDIRHSR